MTFFACVAVNCGFSRTRSDLTSYAWLLSNNVLRFIKDDVIVQALQQVAYFFLLAVFGLLVAIVFLRSEGVFT